MGRTRARRIVLFIRRALLAPGKLCVLRPGTSEARGKTERKKVRLFTDRNEAARAE